MTTEDKKNFDKILAEARSIQESYQNDPRAGSFNMLLLGESGSGKTFMMRTARKPVHIDSFDPGGSKGLRDYISKGEIIVDNRFEGEDPLRPTAFAEWKAQFDKRQRMGYFDHLGTYVLDSSTTWSDAIMNNVLKAAGIAGQAPRFTHDYVPQKIEIRNWIKRMLDLPCDFILTGHLEPTKDEVDGMVRLRYMTTGKGAQTIPLMFDEMWVMDPKKVADGVKYRVLTRSTGTFLARSRLAKEGLIAQYEDPNISAILKKAGFEWKEKPLLK